MQERHFVWRRGRIRERRNRNSIVHRGRQQSKTFCAEEEADQISVRLSAGPSTLDNCPSKFIGPQFHEAGNKSRGGDLRQLFCSHNLISDRPHGERTHFGPSRPNLRTVLLKCFCAPYYILSVVSKSKELRKRLGAKSVPHIVQYAVLFMFQMLLVGFGETGGLLNLESLKRMQRTESRG